MGTFLVAWIKHNLLTPKSGKISKRAVCQMTQNLDKVEFVQELPMSAYECDTFIADLFEGNLTKMVDESEFAGHWFCHNHYVVDFDLGLLIHTGDTGIFTCPIQKNKLDLIEANMDEFRWKNGYLGS
jgi:hypothetical protein